MTRISRALVEQSRRNAVERVRAAAYGRPDWWALAVGFGAGFGAVVVIFWGIPVAIALLNRGL